MTLLNVVVVVTFVLLAVSLVLAGRSVAAETYRCPCVRSVSDPVQFYEMGRTDGYLDGFAAGMEESRVNLAALVRATPDPACSANRDRWEPFG